jgi:O-antigen/teichoic acid export membrane protein
MTSESKATFFRQSGWLVMATTLSGIFLVAIYPVVNRGMAKEEVGVFMSLLRLFTVLAIPAAGLQVVMAQEAAAAILPEQKRQLAVTTRSVLRAIFIFWFLILVVAVIYRVEIIRALKITNPAALWITLGMVLAQLCLPVMQGLLQGMQNFPWLGWSVMLNGAGRFLGIFFVVLFIQADSAGAMLGALIGLTLAVLAGFWPARSAVKAAPGKVDWRRWLARTVPLTCGVGASLFVMNADVLFVQSHFTADIAPLYSAVAVLGVGLVAFTAPMSAVMFPKLVKSMAQSQSSNSFALALMGTVILSTAGATVCTVFPSLPLRIIHFNKPEFWISSQLVPWFMWAMLPVTVANALINNLLARKRFAAVPCLVAVAIAYGMNLYSYLVAADSLPHFEAFKGVVLRLGIFSGLLLAVSMVFTFLPAGKPERGNHAE